MAVGGTKVVQVTNIAPQATKDQMQTLFGYLGKIEDIRLYPTIRDVSCPVQSRICYIKFFDSATVGIAQHMTNTVFIDRALIVIPVQNGDIPDEYYALEMTKNGTIVPGLCPSEPKLPPNVVNSLVGTGTEQVIITTDPQLEASGLPPYPPLPANYDSCKIEETRRTILVPNVNSSASSDDYMEFFSKAGEVKYMRYCTKPSDNTNHLLIEFSEQSSVIEALKINGSEFKGKPIKVLHATQAITKPQAKSNEAAQREIEEAMSRVKEAQSLISAAIDPVIGMLSKDKRSSRRSRSRSRGRRRRSRSRSSSRRRSRSRHRSRHRRSTSRSRRSRSRRRRSKSRSRKRSVSRSRRSSSRSRRSRTKSPHSSRRVRDRRKSRERSRGRSKDKDRKEKERDRKRSRDRGRSSRERSSRSRISPDRVSDDRASRDRASRDRASDRTSKERASRDRISRERSSRDRASIDRASRDRARSRDRIKVKETNGKGRESREKRNDRGISIDKEEKRSSMDKKHSRSRSRYR